MTRQKQYTGIIFLILLLYAICMPVSGLPFDMDCWKRWSVYSYEHGLGNIYNSDTDYLPLYHYVLAGFGFLQGSVKNIENNIHYLKYVTLLFDFAGGMIVYRLICDKYPDPKRAFLKSLFYFLNISLFYNTIIWGQVDGILAFFVFASFYYAYRKKVLACMVFFVLAANFKLEAIIFLPFIGLMVLPSIVKEFNFKKLFYWVVTIGGLQVLILLPFIYAGNAGRVWQVVTGSVGKYPVISMNAYNAWYLLKFSRVFGFLNGPLDQLPDVKQVMGVSLKNWGLIIFSVFCTLAMFPFFNAVVRSVKQRSYLAFPLDKLLLTGALIPLLFFYLNTEMHERYAHVAFIFLIAYCILQNRPWVGIIGSLAYLLNLEDIRQFFQLGIYNTVIFSGLFVSGLYLITIVLLYVDLWDMNWNPFKEKNARPVPELNAG